MSAKTIFPVSSSLEAQLVSGGDDRVSLDPTLGLNKYGCSPFPEVMPAYGYTTASTISSGAYHYISSIYDELQTIEDEFIEDWAISQFHSLRLCIAETYGLGNNEKVIFGASGTDLELVALAVSAACGKETQNIVVGSAETGSGIKFICNGTYHVNQTVLGQSVRIGDIIPGFKDLVTSCEHVPIRDSDGSERSSSCVIQDIKEIVEKGSKDEKHSLIHVVHGSKTGLVKPIIGDLIDSIDRIAGTYDIVVDACQGRVSPSQIRQYLASECMIIFTGSKFFGGPPFSGALMLPESLRGRFRNQMPLGLRDFFTDAEFCDIGPLTGIGATSVNVGLILRWKAASYEMKRYFSLPKSGIIKVMEEFSRAIDTFQEGSRLYRVLDADAGAGAFDSHPLDMRSIYTLELVGAYRTVYEDDESFGEDLYHALHRDISRLVPRELSSVGQYRIQVGQPVTINQDSEGRKPNLRVSLGAPLIADLHFLSRKEIFDKFMSDLYMLENKTHLVLTHRETCSF